MKEILIIRHLEELNDLKKYGRDAPLIESFANMKALESVKENLVKYLNRNDFSAIKIYTSSKIRAKETAQLLIKSNDFKVPIDLIELDNLHSTYQGEFIVPDNYTSGSSFQLLDEASRAFNYEARLGTSSGMNYCFGDPFMQVNKKYKYPLLIDKFKKYGESYKKTLERFFDFIFMIEHELKHKNKLGLIIIAHGQGYHILRGLNILEKLCFNNKSNHFSEHVFNYLWRIYDKCGRQEKIPGTSRMLNTRFIENEYLIENLKLVSANLHKI